MQFSLALLTTSNPGLAVLAVCARGPPCPPTGWPDLAAGLTSQFTLKSMTVRYWRSATGRLLAGARRRILHGRPAAAQPSTMRLTGRSHAGSSQSATKSYQWHTPPGPRSGTRAARKRPTRAASSSSVRPFGRGASSRWNAPCGSAAATAQASPSSTSNLAALSALRLPSRTALRLAHLTASAHSSTATTRDASVLATSWRASGQQPANATQTASPACTWSQILWRSGPILGLKKVVSKLMTTRTPNSLCVVMSGLLWCPAMISRPPGARVSPVSEPTLAATTLIPPLAFRTSRPISALSASGARADSIATSPTLSKCLGPALALPFGPTLLSVASSGSPSEASPAGVRQSTCGAGSKATGASSRTACVKRSILAQFRRWRSFTCAWSHAEWAL
mmetsp:Transcript_67334/g.186605  ORF Transcript_67334/g.186605 Transcript_67334/m.186605 type:complete len:394 (-) Transcript_67334:894-2075(-)